MWLRSSSLHSLTYHHTLSVIVTCYLAHVFCILVVLKHRLLSSRSRASKCLLSPQMILRLHWWDATTFSPHIRILQRKNGTPECPICPWNGIAAGNVCWRLSLVVRVCLHLTSAHIVARGKSSYDVVTAPRDFTALPVIEGTFIFAFPWQRRVCKWSLWGYPSKNYHWWKWIKERCR